MANQYSNYTLQPYVSQYVNPYSAEVNMMLRERYDQNKQNKDKIDATLGGWQTLPGDAHLVDTAKTQTRDKLNQFIEYGNYEDAGLTIGEVMVDLESDRGLKVAKQSYDVRQQELTMMREMTLKNGTQFLDFGRNSINTHQSYYKNDKGEFVENVYQPTNEAMQDYDGAMSKLVGNIRADYTGISRAKADAIAEGLISTYLNSTEGDQDYRRLTEIDGMEHKEAVNNIRQRMQSFTDQHIHQTKAAQINSGASKLNGNGSINKGYTGVPSANMDMADFYNKVLSNNANVFDNWEHYRATGDYSALEHASKYANRMTNAQAKASLTPEEYKNWKNHTVDMYKGHEEFGNLVNYMTTNTYQYTGALDESVDWGEAAVVGGVGLAATGAGMLAFGTANAWNPLGWFTLGALGFGYLVGMGASVGGQMLDNATDERGNVRDWNNPQQGDGLLFGLLDSEDEELVRTLEDTEWVNERLGTNYKNGDPIYEQLKKNARATLLFRQQGGGDEMDDKVNDYDGDVFEAETYVVDYENTKLVNAIDNVEKQYDPHDWNIIGLPEGSDGWKDVFEGDNEGKAPNIKFRGVVAPSIDDDTPLMFKWNINGKTYLAESKENRPGAFDLEELISMDMNQAQLVVLDRARQWVNHTESNSSGAGVDGMPTKQELVETLNTLYQNIVGMGPEDAALQAEQYMFQAFQRANPTLAQMISNEMYGKPYQELEANEKAAADAQINQYYKVYKTSQVRD